MAEIRCPKCDRITKKLPCEHCGYEDEVAERVYKGGTDEN